MGLSRLICAVDVAKKGRGNRNVVWARTGTGIAGLIAYQGGPMKDFQIDAALLQRYDRPGPRYTPYPTAVEFNEQFTAQAYASRSLGRIFIRNICMVFDRYLREKKREMPAFSRTV